MKFKSKLVNGLYWSFIDLFSRQGMQLIVHIILARILLPEHFGLIGMITIFIAISTSIVNSGMDQALIRERKLQKVDYSTVFIFNLILSIFIYFVLFFFAPFIAEFYNEPDLILILRVMMLIIVFNAISLVQRVYLIRALNFKKQTIISFTANIISGSISILLAIFGAGVWSLVAQQLLLKSFESILLILSNRISFTFSFSLYILKKYFVFGYRLMLAGIITSSFNNLLFVVIGRSYGIETLGYYTNASKLRDATSQSISNAFQKVTYPILSQQQDDEERLVQNYKRLIRMAAYLTFPILLGISAISPNLITLLLGEKWVPTIPFFQLLCISGMLYPIHAINLNIIKVKNRSELFLKMEIIKKIFFSIFLVIAIYINEGVMLLLYATILSSVVSLLINMYYSSKTINYSILEQLKDIAKPGFISVVMFFVVLFSNNILLDNMFIFMIIQIFVGITLYIIFSVIFQIQEFKILVNNIHQFMFKR